jgi:hypothetical protein
MQDDRWWFTLTTLSDGKVLAAAGYSYETFTSLPPNFMTPAQEHGTCQLHVNWGHMLVTACALNWGQSQVLTQMEMRVGWSFA